MSGLAALTLSAVISIAVLATLLTSGIAQRILDKPDRRNSMHSTPTPRIGGIGLWTGVFLTSLFAPFAYEKLYLLTLVLCLIFVSWADDRKSLSVTLRLSVQILCVFFYLFYMTGDIQSALERQSYVAHITFSLFIVCAFLLLLLTWFTNLYNFMDGINGLAGLMGLIGFGAMGLVASDSANLWIVSLCISISGACIGFLVFNFPQARLFLGDVGSVPLGFMAGSIGLIGIVHGAWPMWFPLLIFSPFIVDASVTLAKRLWRRERVWEAHRQHYYHRLILDCGWSHTKTALAYACLMLCVSSSALYWLHYRNELVTEEKVNLPLFTAFFLGAWVVIYVLLLSYLEWRFSVQKKKNSKNNKNV
jgi:UDP-GlcNAc:undecaprenyl-phosphate/decaprenyl-phosphate GlcNAc-1-phosphate transferase